MREKRRKLKKRKRIVRLIIIISFLLFFLSGIFMLVSVFIENTRTINNKLEENISSNFSNDNSNQTNNPENLSSESYTNYILEGGIHELPINGASGFASIDMNLYKEPSENQVVSKINQGQGFTILEEAGEWWKIKLNENIGWVMHKYCMVNLPDIIPSIVYNNTNAYSSKLTSSGKNIPNITGLKLYESSSYNLRLNKKEFTVPVLYSMAIKICSAQQSALSDNNTLIIYEGFRPYDVQRKIVDNLRLLAEKDSLVKMGITKSPWSMDWFISTDLSNHQRGYAIDVSLGNIIESNIRNTGKYSYKIIERYEEYSMPSTIHELSIESIVFTAPVSSVSKNAWHKSKLAITMNNEALLLQNYCTNAGLTPLASEWWHFNDLESMDFAIKHNINGKYFIQDNYSITPSL